MKLLCVNSMQLCNRAGHFKGLLILPPTPLLRRGERAEEEEQEASGWAPRTQGTRRAQPRQRRPLAGPALLPHPGSAEEPGQPLSSPGRGRLSRPPAGQARGPRSATLPSPAAKQRTQPGRAPLPARGGAAPEPAPRPPARGALPDGPALAGCGGWEPRSAPPDGRLLRAGRAACGAGGCAAAARSRARAGAAGRAASDAARLAPPPDGGCPAAGAAAGAAAEPLLRRRRCNLRSAGLAGPSRRDARRPGAARSLRARRGRVGRGAVGRGGHQPEGEDEAEREEGPGHAGLRVGHHHGCSPHWHRSGDCAGLPVQEGQRPKGAAGAEGQRARNAAHHFAPLGFQQPGLRAGGGERHCGAHQPHSGGGDSGGGHSTHGPGRHSGGLRKRHPLLDP